MLNMRGYYDRGKMSLILVDFLFAFIYKYFHPVGGEDRGKGGYGKNRYLGPLQSSLYKST